MLKQRTFWGYIGLSIITGGIYSLYWVYAMTRDINQLAKGDGKETSPGLAVVLYIFTCGIYPLIWYYMQGERLKTTGTVQGVPVNDSGATYLLWILLGSLICIGPLVAMAKFLKNYNNLVVVYNNKIVTNANA